MYSKMESTFPSSLSDNMSELSQDMTVRHAWPVPGGGGGGGGLRF